MKQKITISYLERLKKEGYIRDYIIKEGAENNSPNLRKSKYGNRKVFFDNIWFDSQKEATRYMVLRMLEKAGEIKELRLQVPFELNALGSHSLKYICDFVYTLQKTGEVKYEDCKGFKTAVYKKKKKLMKQVYNIEILET